MAAVHKVAPSANSSAAGSEPMTVPKSAHITIERRLKPNESSETCGSYFSSCSPRTIPTLAGPPLISTPVISTKASSTGMKRSPHRDTMSNGGLDDSSDCLESSIVDCRPLKPPENDSVSELPPCKPSSESSDSPAIAKRNSHSTVTDRQRRKLQLRKERHEKLDLNQRRHSSFSWHPTTKAAGPTLAPFKESCYSQLTLPVTNAKQELVRSKFDSNIERKQTCTSTPAKPIVSQTWSSIWLENEIPRNSKWIASDDNLCHRRRTWPPASKCTSLISTIRTRLTCRRVCPSSLETPATITLRRASERPANKKSRPAQIASSVSSNVSAAEKIWQSGPPELSVIAYLITSQDIDYVMDLMQSTFHLQQCQIHHKESFSSPEECRGPMVGSKTSARPSFAGRGCFPLQTNVAADVAMTFTDIHADSNSPSPPRPQGISAHPAESISAVSRVLSRASLHEISWNGKGMPESLRSYSRPTPSSNTSDQSRESRSPSIYFTGENSSDNLKQLASVTECIPKTTHDNEWMTAKPQLFSLPWNEINRESLMKIFSSRTDSQSRSTNPTPQDRSSSPSSSGKSDDVFSFPPLPQRKQTSDWITPLPEICAKPTHEGNQSLYSLGVDATTGTSQSWSTAANEVNGYKTDNSQLPASEGSIPSSNRTKSIVLPHPQALPRICETTKLGSSIGSSRGARRKSSNRPPHVGIEEPLLEPSRRQKSWKKPRKDSGYPRNIEYSSEEDSAEESEQISPAGAGGGNLETLQQRNRRKLLDEKAPQLVRTDPAGIYLALTGTDMKKMPYDSERNGHECVESRKSSQAPGLDWIG